MDSWQVTSQDGSKTTEDDTTERSGATLPAPVEELELFEDDNGTLYAKHIETGAVTAIVDEGAGTELLPAVVDVDSPEVTGLTDVKAMSVQSKESDTVEQRRGD